MGSFNKAFEDMTIGELRALTEQRQDFHDAKFDALRKDGEVKYEDD